MGEQSSVALLGEEVCQKELVQVPVQVRCYHPVPAHQKPHPTHEVIRPRLLRDQQFQQFQLLAEPVKVEE
jgi:hypothetical protein